MLLTKPRLYLVYARSVSSELPHWIYEPLLSLCSVICHKIHVCDSQLSAWSTSTWWPYWSNWTFFFSVLLNSAFGSMFHIHLFSLSFCLETTDWFFSCFVQNSWKHQLQLFDSPKSNWEKQERYKLQGNKNEENNWKKESKTVVWREETILLFSIHWRCSSMLSKG
jgi:hypothetical protein